VLLLAPGGVPTTSVTGRAGQVCAANGMAPPSASNSTSPWPRRRRLAVVESFIACLLSVEVNRAI